jgi:hypothetical protein
MRPKLIIALSLMVFPGAAFAQRGGGRPNDPLAAMEKANEADRNRGVKLSRSDVENMDPIKMLLHKDKDLALTDAQTAQLKTEQDSLTAKNAPLLGSMDSLVYATRTSGASAIQSGRGRGGASAPSGGLTESESADARAARRAVSDVVKQIRANYDAAATNALKALTPDQQPKATELLEKQRKDADKKVRNGLGGR